MTGVFVPHQRLAGILIPAFTPRREGDLGIGDTLALREWIDWAAEYHVGFIQLLPVHENGLEESPYSGISSTAFDPIYLAFEVAEIPGLEEADIDDARAQLQSALTSPLVNYPAVRRVKRMLLERVWARFDHAEPARVGEFKAFKKHEADWLKDYSLFRFLMEHHGESLTWDRWPVDCRTPEQARHFVAKLRQQDREGVDNRLDYFAFVQWLCHRQWLALRDHAEQRGVRLMGDVPIGVSWHSCDAFFEQEEFHLDWYGGSPPEGMSQDDPFFQQWGQNWGIPLYRWDHMQANGFIWWRKRIARLTKIFHMFRLDHILGFYRIYGFPWRPERNYEFLGLSPEQAAEISGGHLPRWFLRPDDSVENKSANREDGDVRLRGILKAAVNAEVIAEDLGWVPEYVRPHLADLGVTGYRIPHWDCNEHGQPTPGNAFPENTFATYSTHDHEPVNGIWRRCLRMIRHHHENPTETSAWAADGAHHTLRILSEFAGIPVSSPDSWPPYTEGIRLRLIKTLFSSNSRYAALMITELFDLDDQINRPGSTDVDNWRFRLPWTLSQIRSDPQLLANCRKLATLIGVTRRA